MISDLPPYAVILSIAGEENHVGVKDRVSIQSAVDGVILRLRRRRGADRVDGGELGNIAVLSLVQHIVYCVRESGVQHAVENDFDNGLLPLGALIAGFEEYDRSQLCQLLVSHFDVDIPSCTGGTIFGPGNLLSLGLFYL